MRGSRRAVIAAAVALVAIGLNVVTFSSAYPAMYQTDTYQTVQTIPPFIFLHSSFSQTQTPYLARDFSAYYIAAWKLVNDPGRVYSSSVAPTDYAISPRPTVYKYAPSFLLFILPFLSLGYQQALVGFNILQLCLLPLMALLTYRLLGGRHPLWVSLATVIVLLQPLPPTYAPLLFRYQSFQPYTISWSYFYNWINGEAKVLQTFLLLGALYYGKTRRPRASALLFSLGAFDPRFALLALPLLLWYNRTALRRFGVYSALFVTAANGAGFYQGIWLQFIGEALSAGVATPVYPYAWIPLYSLTAISALELAPPILGLFRKLSGGRVQPKRLSAAGGVSAG